MQMLKFNWYGGKPGFAFLEGGRIQRMNTLGEKMNFMIGEKRCIGYFRSGKHVKCKEKREIDQGRHCNRCSLEDDFFLCMRCTGEQCINEKQRDSCKENKYFIYLAAFDSTIKVGISHNSRLMNRLIEQGADFGAKVAIVQDGKTVREIEQKMMKEAGVVDRMRGEQKHKNLFCDPNNAVAGIIKTIGVLRSNGFASHLIQPEIYDLREFYGLQHVHSQPEFMQIKTGMQLLGKVVAAKGNLLILQNGGYKSLNAHHLIGRELNVM